MSALAAALVIAPLVLQDAATGTERQREFEQAALARVARAEGDELARLVEARPYRATTLVHNLLRQAATEGDDSWALGAADAIARALAVAGAEPHAASARAQVALYADLDAERRAARLEFDSLWALVGDAMNGGERGRAVELAARARELARLVGDPWLVATGQRRSGLLFLDLGRRDEARAFYSRASQADERHGFWPDLASTHARLGRDALARGRPREALDGFEAARRYAERTDAEPPIDPLEHGVLLAHVGRFDEARAVLGTVRGRARRAETLVALGTVDNAEGRYGDARTRYVEAIAAADGDAAAEAGARIALGGLEAELGRGADARRELERALALLGEVDAPVRRATALAHLATVALDEGDAAEALARIDAARAVLAEVDHASGLRDADAVRARALAAVGSTAEADAVWDACARGFDAAGERPAAARARTAHAESLARRGLDERALAVADAALARLGDADLPELRWRLEAVRARAHGAGGRTDDALAAYDRALATLEELRADVRAPTLRSRYFDDRAGAYRAAALARIDAGDPARAFAAAEGGKARALLDSFGARPEAIAGEALTGARATFDAAQRRYAAALRASEDGARTARAALEQARAELRGARIAFERASPTRATLRGLGSSPDPLHVADALPADTALVEYVVGSDRCAALVVRGGEPTGVALPVSGADVRRWIERLDAPIAALRAGRVDVANLGFDARAAAALYDALVRPLADELAGARAVVVVPDGVLWRAPFAAFVADVRRRPVDPTRLHAHHADHRYWIDEVAIALAPSAAVLVAGADATRESAADGPGLVFVDPGVPPPGSSPLPFARIEAELVGRHGELRAGARCSEAAFRDAAPSARWLHLAVHGRADDADPNHSRLALGRGRGEDGWLHAFEVEALDLGADSVVLSACEAAGDARSGEGVLGLTRAFLAAGARSVVASRWVVEDRAGAELVGRVHDARSGGAPLHEALAAAQRWAAHGGGRAGVSYAHPFFWAGHVVVGAP